MIEDWFRSQGVSRAQRMVIAKNERAIRLWEHLGYHINRGKVRKSLEPMALTTALQPVGLQIERIKDPVAEWPQIWPLMQFRDGRASADPSNADSIAGHAQKKRLESLAEKESKFLLLKYRERPVGFLSGRVVENPWILEERVGSIEDFAVEPEVNAKDRSENLLHEIESWFLSKNLSSVHHIVAAKNLRFWTDQNYSLYFAGLSKEL